MSKLFDKLVGLKKEGAPQAQGIQFPIVLILVVFIAIVAVLFFLKEKTLISINENIQQQQRQILTIDDRMQKAEAASKDLNNGMQAKLSDININLENKIDDLNNNVKSKIDELNTKINKLQMSIPAASPDTGDK